MPAMSCPSSGFLQLCGVGAFKRLGRMVFVSFAKQVAYHFSRPLDRCWCACFCSSSRSKMRFKVHGRRAKNGGILAAVPSGGGAVVGKNMYIQYIHVYSRTHVQVDSREHPIPVRPLFFPCCSFAPNVM